RVDAVEIVRLNHQRIAVPSSNVISVPVRHDLSRRRKRAAVQIDLSQAVIRLGDVDELPRRLDDLERLRIDVVLKRPLRQAQAIRIVQSLFGEALLLKLRRPGLEGQSALESSPRVAASDKR